ncbi:MAG: hypothetical protein ACLQBQ_03065 [Smithella sp.]
MTNNESQLNKTGWETDLYERIKSNYERKLTTCCYFKLKDLLLIIVLIAAVFLAYQPAWYGGVHLG